MKKKDILSEIKRTGAENGGVPLGIDRFREATSIRKEDWYGIFWARWSDAQREAGFEPNRFGKPALDEKWTLVLVMSEHSVGKQSDSEWVALERHTARFRDPTKAAKTIRPAPTRRRKHQGLAQANR